MVDKPLEIIGDGPVEDIEIRATGANVLEFRASIGRVANLTLRQADTGPLGVAVFQGRLDLEGCDISGRGNACVYILDSADPRLRRNKIHDGVGNGVQIDRAGLGTLEDNDIARNSYSGVSITEGSNATVRGNRINRNGEVALNIFDEGKGVVEDNDLTGNDRGSWLIDEDCEPNVTRARNEE